MFEKYILAPSSATPPSRISTSSTIPTMTIRRFRGGLEAEGVPLEIFVVGILITCSQPFSGRLSYFYDVLSSYFISAGDLWQKNRNESWIAFLSQNRRLTLFMAVLRIVFSPHSCSSVQMTWFTCTRRMKQSHHPPTFQKSKFVKELVDKLE